MQRSLKYLRILVLLVGVSPLVVGCSTTWPWQSKTRTSITTPAMRIAAIRETGTRAYKMDSAEQQRASEELAMQIRTEPDPLVRQAIQESIAQFSTPLATQVLLAGLNDDHLEVRLSCCQKLGVRADPTTVAALQSVIETGKTLDDRLAAVDALSQIKTDQSIAALTIALKDRDPAMQFAAVNGLRNVTGQDLGNDVKVWLEYAESGQTPRRPNVSLAERAKSWMSF